MCKMQKAVMSDILLRMCILPLQLCLVLAPTTSALAQTTAPQWYGPEWMWWGGPFHMFVPLLSFLLLVAVVIMLVRKLWSDEPRYRTTNHARDLLDERYAKGEIEREEYLRRRQDIQGN
jgi:putative membrane protein